MHPDRLSRKRTDQLIPPPTHEPESPHRIRRAHYVVMLRLGSLPGSRPDEITQHGPVHFVCLQALGVGASNLAHGRLHARPAVLCELGRSQVPDVFLGRPGLQFGVPTCLHGRCCSKGCSRGVGALLAGSWLETGGALLWHRATGRVDLEWRPCLGLV